MPSSSLWRPLKPRPQAQVKLTAELVTGSSLSRWGRFKMLSRSALGACYHPDVDLLLKSSPCPRGQILKSKQGGHEQRSRQICNAAKKDKFVFICKVCGQEHVKFGMKCDGCGQFNTMPGQGSVKRDTSKLGAAVTLGGKIKGGGGGAAAGLSSRDASAAKVSFPLYSLFGCFN